jgi:hypothetical protein
MIGGDGRRGISSKRPAWPCDQASDAVSWATQSDHTNEKAFVSNLSAPPLWELGGAARLHDRDGVVEETQEGD